MKVYDNLISAFNKNRLGNAAIAIIGQSCLGSVAAMSIILKRPATAIMMTELFLVTGLCMAFNSAILINLNAKTTANLLIASVLCSIVMIIINLA